MKYIFLVLLFATVTSFGPPNCNIYEGNCKLACLEAEKAVKHGQGTYDCQKHFAQSIELCPTFDYSYFEMAVPYAKRGFMKEWKPLIDKAVELNPVEHLPTRGWYHFFFMRNYKKAIQDIDRYDSLIDYDIGHTGDALYHLNIMKGLCWKEMGEPEKAINTIQSQLNADDHMLGAYDYLHLGVCYLENNQPQMALDALNKQKQKDDIAEVYYYSAISYEALGKEEEKKKNLEMALNYYNQDRTMNNPYRQLIDEIFKDDITSKLNSM